MIQDIGALRFDNHFEPLEPGETSYVLHYRDCGALVSVVRPGEGGADAGSADDVIELPRLADYPVLPRRTVYLFSVGDERYFLALDEEVELPRGFGYEAMAIPDVSRGKARGSARRSPPCPWIRRGCPSQVRHARAP